MISCPSSRLVVAALVALAVASVFSSSRLDNEFSKMLGHLDNELTKLLGSKGKRKPDEPSRSANGVQEFLTRTASAAENSISLSARRESVHQHQGQLAHSDTNKAFATNASVASAWGGPRSDVHGVPKVLCNVEPPDDPDATDDTNVYPVILSIDEESNSRILTLPGSPIMSYVRCRGQTPTSCKGEDAIKKSIAECPTCPCDQDTSRKLDLRNNQRFRQYIDAACQEGQRPPRSLHIGLGLGAFVTNVRETCKGSVNDVVEFDPRSVDISKYFGGKWDNLEIKSCDQAVRDHLGVKDLAFQPPSCSEQYDFIFLDVFDHSQFNERKNTPEVCRNHEFIQNVWYLLRDDGCIIANLDPSNFGEASPIFAKHFNANQSCLDGIWCKGSARPDCASRKLRWVPRRQQECPAQGKLVHSRNFWFLATIALIAIVVLPLAVSRIRNSLKPQSEGT